MINKINLFSEYINNPITREALISISGYCEKCGKNRVEVVLELFTGVRKNACWKCKLAEKMATPVLKKGAETFDISVDALKEKFKDAYWRKGLASVIKGLALFGVRKPFVPGAPFQLVWDITYGCNLKCKHCYATAGKPLPDELTTEEALDVIDKLDKFGITILAFSGGEPLVRKDIFELTNYASEKGMYVAIATNGTLITEDMAKRMKENGVSYVQISLDGMKKTHEEFRGMSGVFDKTVEGIRNSVKEGFFVNVSMTVTKFNYNDVDPVIDLCEKLGVSWFMHYNFIPTGRGGTVLGRELDITPEMREKLLNKLYEKNKTSNISILSTAPQFARIVMERDAEYVPTHFYNVGVRGLADFIGGCGAGRFYISLRANGDIQPCVFFPLKIGNIREDDLEKLWKESNILRELRDRDILERCGTCEYRYYCGGCRARAYNCFGDYLMPDPGCILNCGNKEVCYDITH